APPKYLLLNFNLEHDLCSELDDALSEDRGRQAEVGERSGGLVLKDQAATADRVLLAADAGYVEMVEEVERLAKQLQLRPLGHVDCPGEARIERVDGRQAVGVASHARRTVGLTVAVVVQVRSEQGRVGLSALCRENAAERPSAEHSTSDADHVLRIVQIPDTADDETMAHVIRAIATVGIDVEGIRYHLRIVAAGERND